MTGSHIVPANHANAITLMPSQYAQSLNLSGAKMIHSLPLAIMENVKTKLYFYIDWGIKIQADGSYFLSFTGNEQHFITMGLSNQTKIKLDTGEFVSVEDWIPKMKETIKGLIDHQVNEIKNGDIHKKLTQEDIATLLEKIKKTAELYMPGIHSFFTADYIVDRTEALSYISDHASQHYRRCFTFEADYEDTYKITINNF